MAQECDVAVLGSTPAGLVAAVAMARAKRRVVVVDAPAEPTESPLADWVPRDFFTLAPFLKALPDAMGAEPFAGVLFHSADATRSAEYRVPRGAAGYALPAGALPEALTKLVRKANVQIVTADARPALHLEETRVRVDAGDGVTARLLLIAQDTPARVINELSLPVRAIPSSPLRVTGLDIPWTAAKISKHFPPGLRVVDMPLRGQLGLFFPVGATLHVRLIQQQEQEEGSAAVDLSTLLSMLQRSGLLPADLPMANVRGAVWRPPSGVALDLETHVAKRTLLAGTAGGFAGAMSGQTIVPTVRSALVAVRVIEKALDAPEEQGALGAFKNEWRKALADYLRPPNTALNMLLPLLFVNRQMVDRIARAMLYGESI